MFSLDFKTDEERKNFIDELSKHLSLSVKGELDKERGHVESVKLKVSLLFDDEVVCSDSDIF